LTSSGHRPRLAFLITSSGAGGAEQQVRALAIAFRGRGWDVAVLSMLPLEPLLLELADYGVELASVGMSRGIPDPRGVWRLRRFLRRWRPDVLHAHMVHANLLARVSRLVISTPVIVSTMHNQNEGAQWRYVAYRLTDRLTDITTTVSRLAVSEAVRRGAVTSKRIRLVPNGIDLAPYVANAPLREATREALDIGDRFAWLAVGRLTEAKAYDDMIAAFVTVARRDDQAILLVAGDGPLENDVRTWIDRAGLVGRIRLLGHRADVPALMQAADGFVLSSAWEGLPMVLLEAAAAALPLVATDVGGTREVVLDAVSGHVTPAGDVTALGSAMLSVMALPAAARRSMGEAGRAHVAARFELASVVTVWEQLYQALLGRAAR
jgi:glycosyltransferase involved in cell wall biosynthesis